MDFVAVTVINRLIEALHGMEMLEPKGLPLHGSKARHLKGVKTK